MEIFKEVASNIILFCSLKVCFLFLPEAIKATINLKLKITVLSTRDMLIKIDHIFAYLTGLTVTFPAVSSVPDSFEKTHLNEPM